MKKIYLSKIRTIAMMAFVFMANVAIGQNLKVTSNGKPVSNNDIVEVAYAYEDFSMPDLGMYFYQFTWDPHLEVSTVDGEYIEMTATVSSIDNTKGFQICWPMQCQFINAGGSVTSTGVVGEDPVDLEIHKEVSFDQQGVIPTESDGGSIKVTLMTSSETMELTVKCIIADINAVGETIEDINANTTYYNLEGIQIAEPAKGMYIMKKGSKAKLVYKK